MKKIPLFKKAFLLLLKKCFTNIRRTVPVKNLVSLLQLMLPHYFPPHVMSTTINIVVMVYEDTVSYCFIKQHSLPERYYPEY